MTGSVTTSNPTIAIAFGGGGARGLAHIHIVEALDEMGIRPVAITGSSIGAIIGAGMAAGMSGKDIREFTLSTVGHPREVMNRSWSLRPPSFRDIVNCGFRAEGTDLDQVHFKTGMSSRQCLRKALRMFGEHHSIDAHDLVATGQCAQHFQIA